MFLQSLKTISIVLFILTFLTGMNTTFAQNDDDPANEDHIPMNELNNYNSQPKEILVITQEGYDNFDIGVDFAEPHLSSNPLIPYQYFNAWNTNSTHYTLDGWTWLNQSPSFGQTMRGDPVTAYDSLGNLYYENMYGASSILGCVVLKSTNNGQTWGTPTIAISGRDKNWIACDQTSGPYANYVYTTMTGPSTGSVGNFTRSTNFGVSWTQTATFNTQVLPGMMAAVGPDTTDGVDISGGCVYVVTHSGTNGAGTYTFYRSTDGGLTFTLRSANNFSNYIGTEISGRSTVNGMRTRPYPFIAADNSYGPYRGRLYLVYASNNPTGNGNKPDIFCRYSNDQGATWSTARIVNDDVNSQNNNNFFPAIWCDNSNGRLYVKWYDSRLVPTSDSVDVYATFTTDGGDTFVPNQRITNRTAKTKISSSGSAPAYQGDYDAITSHGDQGMLVWTDFRNNNFGSYGGYFPDFAMLASPNIDTLANDIDSSFIKVFVPSVKLYTNTVEFTSTYSPIPASGTLSVTAIGSTILTSYPDTVTYKVTTSGNVTPGDYTVIFTGKGPNGLPVHKRNVTLRILQVIPVELVSFNVYLDDKNVILNWLTVTELNNKGFEIERTKYLAGSNSKWQKIGFVEGHGSKTSASSYEFIDKGIVEDGKYFYRLKQIDYDGTVEYSNEIEVDITGKIVYVLSQNYPNPFNPTTQINYSIPVKGNVSLKIYDILGKEVMQLINEAKDAGNYSVKVDASSFSSGVYFYELKSGNFSEKKKLVVLK